jgi:hypothetical protein
LPLIISSKPTVQHTSTLITCCRCPLQSHPSLCSGPPLLSTQIHCLCRTMSCPLSEQVLFLPLSMSSLSSLLLVN